MDGGYTLNEGEAMTVTVDVARCTGCTVCVQSCPSDVLRMKGGKAYVAYPESCTDCFTCELDCTRVALKVVPVAAAAFAITTS